MRGPLYNGQDYLGDDPDPSARAFLIKNLSGRYGGNDQGPGHGLAFKPGRLPDEHPPPTRHCRA